MCSSSSCKVKISDEVGISPGYEPEIQRPTLLVYTFMVYFFTISGVETG